MRDIPVSRRQALRIRGMGAHYAATVASLRARMEELRRELGDSDPPGPAPRAEGCHDGHALGWETKARPSAD